MVMVDICYVMGNLIIDSSNLWLPNGINLLPLQVYNGYEVPTSLAFDYGVCRTKDSENQWTE